MPAKGDDNRAIAEKLDTVIELLRHSLALQLSKDGVPVKDIAKSLHVAKATVVNMLKGVRKAK